MFSRITRATLTQARSHHHHPHRCPIHTSPALPTAESQPTPTVHTTDSYNKDTDTSPPADSKIHRVDPGSENVQKPYEAPSGEWSRAGTRTHEYMSTTGRPHPYAVREGGGAGGAGGAGASQSEGGTAAAGMTSGGTKPQGR